MLRTFTRCIIADSLGKPMVWLDDEKRMVYARMMNPKSPLREAQGVLRSYTIKEANDLIKQHIESRKARNWDTSEMQIIPFAE